MAIANPEQSKSDGLRSGDPETVAQVTIQHKNISGNAKMRPRNTPKGVPDIRATRPAMVK